jgi:hypothetical protein
LFDRYARIRMRGWIIDVRGTFPTLLLGLRAWTFRSWEEALVFAERGAGLAAPDPGASDLELLNAIHGLTTAPRNAMIPEPR